MRRMLIAVLVVITIVIAASFICASHASTPPYEQLPPTQQLAADNTAFGMDLYNQFRESDGNLFFSPFSISQAFAMLYAGARGETAEEMAWVLHITLDNDELHEAYRTQSEGLFERRKATVDEKFKLNIANGLWTQEGFPIHDNYVTLLNEFYQSEPAALDFTNDTEQSRRTINNWVSDKTEGMIEDILPKGSISPATPLVLANTIYFEARWSSRFLTQNTVDGEFYLLDNSTISVPMMHNSSMLTKMGYAEDDDWQAAELQYSTPGREMGILIILPHMGKFSEAENMLDEEFIASLDNALHKKILVLTIPKFSFTSPSMDLKEILIQIGMQSVFTRNADLSGISTQKLILSGAYHKASVTVDEEGTIAAGATVLPGFMGIPINDTPIEFTANRPFIFLIRDLDTKAVLFMGRVLDPTEQ